MAPERATKGSTTRSKERAWETLDSPLSAWILDAVSAMGLKKPTPVQASTIPLFMGNKDVVVEAVTGSGKTLAFLIPLIEKLLRLEEPTKRHHVAAIIVSPTRELASQIHSVLKSVLAFHGPSAAAAREIDRAISGEREDHADDEEGTPEPEYPASTLVIRPQLLLGGDISTTQDLRYFIDHSPNLIISTPGRLLELLSSPNVRCPQSSFEALVLDEADRLLDLGFKDELQKILGRLPKQRRTGLFSASVSEAVDQLVRVGLRNPVKVAVKVRSLLGGQDQTTPASLQMRYMTVPASHKLPAVGKLIHTLDPMPNKTIVYFSTCAAVDYFQHILPSIISSLPASSGQSSPKFKIVPLHGKHPAKIRTRNFTTFTTSLLPSILLTTDVAARGLDIPQVDLVIQMDPPTDPKVFIHRCGRAGRAGRAGLSVLFLHPGRESEEYVPFLSVRNTPISPLSLPPAITISEEGSQTATSTIRNLVLRDRSLHDLAQRAFVSGIKAYSKHQASSIFRVSDLDWIDLANAWGLLKLPRMPELKKWEGDAFLGLDIDFSTYAYKDKTREKARLERLRSDKATTTPSSAISSTPPSTTPAADKKRPWSANLDRQQERERQRSKKRTKREKEKWKKMTDEERSEAEALRGMIEEVKKQKSRQREEGGDGDVDGDTTTAANGEFEGFGDL